jgi:uncharacterized YigZ family protein
MTKDKKLVGSYLTIFEDGEHEIEIKKSRFICHLKRVSTEKSARNFIADIKKIHWRASHNCSAFVVGKNAEIERSNDDGEPSGTAGVPMLEVLKKSELVNVCAVVTRYFGGVKLGAGGLIRAYAQSVAQALVEIGIAKGELQQEISLLLDYSFHNKVEHFLEINSKYFLKEVLFTEKVEMIVFVSEEMVESFQEDVRNLLNGKVDFSLGEFKYHESLVK